jgi:hypothetical protein
MKGLPEISIRGVGERKTTREVVTLQRDEFHVCQPIIREVSAWFGLKKKALLVHRTAEGKWDIKQVKI